MYHWHICAGYLNRKEVTNAYVTSDGSARDTARDVASATLQFKYGICIDSDATLDLYAICVWFFVVKAKLRSAFICGDFLEVA